MLTRAPFAFITRGEERAISHNFGLAGCFIFWKYDDATVLIHTNTVGDGNGNPFSMFSALIILVLVGGGVGANARK